MLILTEHVVFVNYCPIWHKNSYIVATGLATEVDWKRIPTYLNQENIRSNKTHVFWLMELSAVQEFHVSLKTITDIDNFITNVRLSNLKQ